MNISNLYKYLSRITLFILGLSFISITLGFKAHATMPKCHPPGGEDPLLVDLGGDGINLGPKGLAVMFDLMGNGKPRAMQWTAANGNEAFLAMDKNGNGIVDNGYELFTNYNLLLLENTPAANGFADLAQYDHPELGGNDDGYISASDQIWPQLKLWLDINADAISSTDEMFELKDFELTRFNTVPRINNRRDPAGNQIPLWSWTKGTSSIGESHYLMVDVFFKPLFDQ